MKLKKIIYSSMSILLVCAMSFAMCGCGSTPAESAEIFLNAMKQSDAQTMQGVYSGDDASEEINSLLSILDEDDLKNGKENLDEENINKLKEMILDFDYTIGDVTEDGNNATVKVSITTYDLESAMENYLIEFVSQGMVLALKGGNSSKLSKLSNKLLSQELESCEKNLQTDISLPMVKTGGKWKVVDFSDNDTIMNALTGNLGNLEDEINNLNL